jgi:uncharacterized protein YqeY
MADLRTQITSDMKQAMKDGDKNKLATLRLINASLKDKDIEIRVAGTGSVTDADVLTVMQKMIKQREDSLKMYRDNGRDELANQEESEIKIIKAYMPAMMSDDELQSVIASAITESGAAGPADMGKVMAILKSKYTGQIDMGKASGQVKKALVG